MSHLITSPTPLQRSIMDVVKTWALSRSKDPTSKVGAGIYDPRTGGLFLGYNGFPKGVPDAPEIWNNRAVAGALDVDLPLTKYDLVVHAEMNAVRKALMAGVDLSKAELFCTHMPCPHCTRDVIVSNSIANVYFEIEDYRSNTPRNRFVTLQLIASSSTRFAKLGIES
jgi:deoxycytidylate deaminase